MQPRRALCWQTTQCKPTCMWYQIASKQNCSTCSSNKYACTGALCMSIFCHAESKCFNNKNFLGLCNNHSGLEKLGDAVILMPLFVSCHIFMMVDTFLTASLCSEAPLNLNHLKKAATTLICTPTVLNTGSSTNMSFGKKLLLAMENCWYCLHIALMRECQGMIPSTDSTYCGKYWNNVLGTSAPHRFYSS